MGQKVTTPVAKNTLAMTWNGRRVVVFQTTLPRRKAGYISPEKK